MLPERMRDMILDGLDAPALERHIRAQLQTPLQDRSLPQKFCVGLSGGADSTALLVAASHIVGPSNVRALHGDHRLHSQSTEWVAHCQRLCDQLGVELVIGVLRLAKGNVEAAARQARYDFFADQLQTNETLLLGHHSQDQLETVFMRLIQGRSLLPMRLHGRLGKGAFLRPLLALKREHLLDYLTAQKITWIDDPSNCDQALTRNFLRHRILPVLLQRWPSLAEAVHRLAEWQQGQNGLLHELLKEQGNEVSVAELPQSAASRRAWRSSTPVSTMLSVARQLKATRRRPTLVRLSSCLNRIHVGARRRIRMKATVETVSGQNSGARTWKGRGEGA